MGRVGLRSALCLLTRERRGGESSVDRRRISFTILGHVETDRVLPLDTPLSLGSGSVLGRTRTQPGRHGRHFADATYRHQS